jgi:hypothetical membrane protein
VAVRRRIRYTQPGCEEDQAEVVEGNCALFVDMKRKLLLSGVATPIVFWTATFIAGGLTNNYNQLKNTISELGQIGAPAANFMFVALSLLAVIAALFSFYFYQACKRLKISFWPAIFSFSLPISMLWAGIFPMGNSLHDKQGPLPLLLLLGMFVAIFQWPKRHFKKERSATIIASLLALLIFLRFVKPFGNEYEGLVQRFYYLGWTIWCISIGILFSDRLNGKKTL